MTTMRNIGFICDLGMAPAKDAILSPLAGGVERRGETGFIRRGNGLAE